MKEGAVNVFVTVGGGAQVLGKCKVTVYAHLYSNYVVVDRHVGRGVHWPNLTPLVPHTFYSTGELFAATALTVNVVVLYYSTIPALVDRVLREEFIVLRQHVR